MEPLDPWYAKTLLLMGSVMIVAIRAPHGQRSRTVPVAHRRQGGIERTLLALAWVAFFLPLLWVFTPWFGFADYPLRPLPLGLGALAVALGLVLFHRSHADLGTNWSITLEVREGHRLVTHGVYRQIRHPMYTALLLHGAGLAVAVPNWVAGPIYLVVMALLVACRLGPEEALMRATFGAEYEAYASRTRRLVPYVW